MADPQPTILPPVGPSILPPSNDNSGPTTSTPQGSVPLPTPPPSDTPAWATTGQNAATMTGGYAGAPTLSADVSVQQPPPPPGQDTASGGGTKPDGSDVPKSERQIDPTKVPQPPAGQPPYNGPPPVDPFAIGEHPEFKAHYDQMQKDLEQARAATEEANRRLIEMYKQGEFQTQRYREVMNEALENERTMTQLQNRIAMHPPTRSTNDQQVAAAGMGTALASIGGRLANPTSMLVAMGAASNAAVDRNDELFKQNMEVWKTQADLVGHGAELESKLQSDAVSAAGNNSKMLLDQLTPLAQVTQNTSLLHKLENGDYESAIKQVQDYRKLAEDFPIHQIVAQAGLTAWHQIQTDEAQWSKDHGDQPVPDDVKQAIEQKAIAGYNRTVAPLDASGAKPSYTNWSVPDPDKPGQTKTVSAAPDVSGTGLRDISGTYYPTGTKVPESQRGENASAPKAYTMIMPDGKSEGVNLSWLPQEKRWWDVDKNQPFVKPPGAVVQPAPASGGRIASAQVNSMVAAGNDTVKALSNLVELPVTATTGWFMGTETHPAGDLNAWKNVLAHKMQPSEVRALQITFQGVQRAMATLEAQGRATGLVGLTTVAGGLAPQQGDHPIDIMRKYAEIRQIVETNLDAVAHQGNLNPTQQKYIEDILARVQVAFPYTVHDVNQLEFPGSRQTITDVAARLKSNYTASQERAVNPQGTTYDRQQYEAARQAGTLKPGDLFYKPGDPQLYQVPGAAPFAPPPGSYIDPTTGKMVTPAAPGEAPQPPSSEEPPPP